MVSELQQKFEDCLVNAIYETVRSYRCRGRAYCLVLNYGGDASRGCIPVIGLGILRKGETISIPSENVSPDEEWLWNPAEFSNFGSEGLQPRASELFELDQKLQSECAGGGVVELKEICNRVSIRLNKLNWTPLKTSKEFIAYSVDDDLVDLDENLQLAKCARTAG